MNAAEFNASMANDHPPALSEPLQALWWDARNDWHHAHEAVAAASGREAAWVHAYLHRKEGDAGNAAYWYARAGRPVSRQPLGEEWSAIVAALLG